MKIKPISRIIGRILDYFLFYIVVKFTLVTTGLHLSAFAIILFTLLLPLFWIPFEALMISQFGTTLGYAFFGVRIRDKEGEKLSFAQAFKRSCLIGLKALSPVNLLYPILFLCRKSESGFDRKHEIQIQAKGGKRVIGTLLLITCFSGWLFEEQIFENPTTVSSIFGNNKDWFHFAHPEGVFAADFPKNPIFTQKPLPVPGKRPLDYFEYSFQEKGVTYSVSYTNLPKSWLQWGSGLLLKGVIKAIAAHLPKTEVVSKRTIKYQNLPGLSFVFHQSGEKNLEMQGRLLLKQNTVYKVEVSYPKEKREEVQDKIEAFLNSFNADSTQILSSLEEKESSAVSLRSTE